jgi:glycosyltransferase involved in cell wall biosynthesis
MLSPTRVSVVMPVRDDWTSAAELIRRLDHLLGTYECIFSLVLVDDGSTHPHTAADFQSDFNVVRTIQILRLRRNLGHQRAIAIGIVHASQTIPCDAVLVMDADGEDTPEGVLQLLRAFSEDHLCEKAVFAARTRRTESLVFRLSYWFYKALHRMLTGIRVRVGNFSILPAAHLDRLIVMSELWNHYAAAVFRSGLPFTTIPIPRGYRIAGKSKMNFVSLVVHGMSAISVFADAVGVRLLVASLAGAFVAALGILAVIIIRLATDRAIPGWATYSVGTLVVILIQCVAIAGSFTFTMLSNRVSLNFVPIRDYELFVLDKLEVYRVE